MSSIKKTINQGKKRILEASKIKVLFDSTKTNEYKGAHSIGCKN